MKPKKSLGQNFLTSEAALRNIIASADYTPGLTAVEIGPGRGVLTTELLKKFDKVIAVEKDAGLIDFLKDKFAEAIKDNHFTLIYGDILEMSTQSVGLSDKNQYAVVANIPYYITGQFIRQSLEAEHKPTYMVLMVQNEVAKRIVAKDGKESILSLSVKAYGEPEYIAKVNRGSFYPAPNVDSAILKISNISNKNFEQLVDSGACSNVKMCQKLFFELLHASFAHKRKFLTRNIEPFVKKIGAAPTPPPCGGSEPTSLQPRGTVGKPWGCGKVVEIALTSCGLPLTVRAEDLKISDFIHILQQILTNRS